MEYKQPEAKNATKSQPDTGKRAPIDNDLRMNDDDAQQSNPTDQKGQTGRGRLSPQPEMTAGARKDPQDNEDGAHRNPGRPGDAPEEKRGTGTRTGGSPQSEIKPGAGKPNFAE